jgi:hypothetical protein
MSVTLFNSPLTTTFQATSPLMVLGETVSCNFTVTVANTGTALLGRIEFYAEYTDLDPLDVSSRWWQELSETNAGSGDVVMAKTIRRFTENGGANLAVASHHMNVVLLKKAQFMRFQIRQATALADACTARIDAVFGEIPQH